MNSLLPLFKANFTTSKWQKLESTLGKPMLKKVAEYTNSMHSMLDKKKMEQEKTFLVLAGNDEAGKKIIVELIAKETNKNILKVDAKKFIQNYIGETEKNLSRLFKEALATNSILLFDEADALFGKRTKVKDSHDKYANQEVSYLLNKLPKQLPPILFIVARKTLLHPIVLEASSYILRNVANTKP